MVEVVGIEPLATASKAIASTVRLLEQILAAKRGLEPPTNRLWRYIRELNSRLLRDRQL